MPHSPHVPQILVSGAIKILDLKRSEEALFSHNYAHASTPEDGLNPSALCRRLPAAPSALSPFAIRAK
ncbi:hypothetical protein EVAR_36785_1 [Eumeta japonica]|uniref:Uncharacterized protein n=1 Tax=Eumeta variegata TaxID=151549 RepID=A0A4C1WWB4_EUMVA|nr:hypothetical protein EVAR_36785_1 [Eumeta japonica]